MDAPHAPCSHLLSWPHEQPLEKTKKFSLLRLEAYKTRIMELQQEQFHSF